MNKTISKIFTTITLSIALLIGTTCLYQGNFSTQRVFAGAMIMLTYDVEGGNPLDPSSTTIANNSTNVQLAIPTKTGYVFEGWYDGDDGTGTQLTGSDGILATASTLSNITIYAKWGEETHTCNEIVFNQIIDNNTVSITTSGNYYLNNDVLSTGDVVIGNGVDATAVNICVNNCTWDLGSNKILIKGLATVNIYDCGGTSEIKSTNISTIEINNAGVLTLNNGNITNRNNVNVFVYVVKNNGTFNIYGGTLLNYNTILSSVIYSTGTTNMNNGLINVGVASNNAYGINAPSGEVNITGGDIGTAEQLKPKIALVSENTSSEVTEFNVSGGNIYAVSHSVALYNRNAIFNLSGTAKLYEYLAVSGRLNMSGGLIKSTSGINLNGGKLYISGGKIDSGTQPCIWISSYSNNYGECYLSGNPELNIINYWPASNSGFTEEEEANLAIYASIDEEEYSGEEIIVTKDYLGNRAFAVGNIAVRGVKSAAAAALFSIAQDHLHLDYVDSDDTLVVVAEEYNIAYYDQGAEDEIALTGTPSSTLPSKYAYGSEVTIPTLSKEGYTFNGWFTTYNGNVAASNISSTDYGVKKYYASWTVNTYNVAFNHNIVGYSSETNGTMSNQSFTYGTAQNLTTCGYTRAGYTFAGWATSSEGEVVYADGQNVNNLINTNNGEITLYAKWSANTNTAYTVEYYFENILDDIFTKNNSKTQNLTGTTGATVDAVILTETGFAHDTTNTNKVESGLIAGEGNLVLKVYYKRLRFSLAFETPSTSSYATGVKYGTTPNYEFDDPIKEDEYYYDYVFTGWTDGTNNYDVDDVLPQLTDNIVYTATFSHGAAKPHYQIFDINGGSVDDNQSDYVLDSESGCYKYYFDIDNHDRVQGEEDDVYCIKAPSVSRSGYTFIGWFLIISPNYIGRDYDIVTEEVEVILAESLDDPRLDADANMNGILSNSYREYTFIAKWAANTYDVVFNHNIVGYNSETNGTMSNQSFTYDIAQNLTTCGYTRVGYTFAGWATSSEGYMFYADGQNVNNLIDTNNGEIILYAKWTVNTYDFNLVFTNLYCQQIDEGNNIDFLTHGQGTWGHIRAFTGYEVPTSVTLTRGDDTLVAGTDYTYFVNYQDRNGQLTINASAVTGDIVFTAAGVLIDFDLIYDVNGGNELTESQLENKQIVNYEKANFALPVPTRTGYTFDGWFFKILDDDSVLNYFGQDIFNYYMRLISEPPSVRTDLSNSALDLANSIVNIDCDLSIYLFIFDPEEDNLSVIAKWKPITYTIDWKNGETTLETDLCEYGTIPVYNGVTPTKSSTETYKYEFSGWDSAITNATCNKTYIAQFTQKLIKIVTEDESTPIEGCVDAEIEISNGLALEEDDVVKLVVVVKPNEEITLTIPEDKKALKTYNAILYKNEEETTPTGKMLIKIQKPVEVGDNDKITILMKGAEGTEVYLDAVVKDNYIVFTTTTLGDFAIVVDKDHSLIWLWLLLAAIVISLILLLIIRLKRKVTFIVGEQVKAKCKYSFNQIITTPTSLAGFVWYKDKTLVTPFTQEKMKWLSKTVYGKSITNTQKPEKETFENKVIKIDGQNDVNVKVGSLSKKYIDKLNKLTEQQKADYCEIKNEILSYSNLDNAITQDGDTFRFKKDIKIKISIIREQLKFFIDLDIEDIDGRFKRFEASQFKKYTSVPLEFTIDRQVEVRKAKNTINRLAKHLELTKGTVYSKTFKQLTLQ